jgi:protein-histidine pros-kinase
MASLGWVFLAVVLLLNLMLHYIVLKPMEQVNSFARAVSLGEMDAEIYQKSGRDEIAQLATSFNRMRRSLDTAMRMLGT